MILELFDKCVVGCPSYTRQQKKCPVILGLYFFIASKVEPIKTRLLVSVMIIIGGLANLTICNPFDEYLVRFTEGLRNIDFDHHYIGRRGKALCARDSIRFS